MTSLGRVRTNAFGVTDDTVYQFPATAKTLIGEAIYIEGSVFNHSCAPNAQRVFTGSQIEIRATRDIHEGEEVTIAYLSLSNYEREEYRNKLREQYYFDCECKLCNSSAQDDPRNVESIKHSIDLNEKVKRAIKESKFQEASSLFEQFANHKARYDGETNKYVGFLLYDALQCLTFDKNGPKKIVPGSSEFPRVKQVVQRLNRVALLGFGKEHKFYKQFIAHLDKSGLPLDLCIDN